MAKEATKMENGEPPSPSKSSSSSRSGKSTSRSSSSDKEKAEKKSGSARVSWEESPVFDPQSTRITLSFFLFLGFIYLCHLLIRLSMTDFFCFKA